MYSLYFVFARAHCNINKIRQIFSISSNLEEEEENWELTRKRKKSREMSEKGKTKKINEKNHRKKKSKFESRRK